VNLAKTLAFLLILDLCTQHCKEVCHAKGEWYEECFPECVSSCVVNWLRNVEKHPLFRLVSALADAFLA